MPFQNSSARIPRHRLILAGIMVVLVVLVVVIVSVAVLSSGRRETPSLAPSQWKGGGTTEHLQEIVLGRCYNFVATANPELKDFDCSQVWQRLQKAFAYRDPCSMTEEDYQPLMDLASYFIPCNKSLFWSKTKDLVHRFTKANHDFLTLEDTLVGYIANELSWCGDLATGINYQSCPKWSECENNPSTIYWKMASKMFAEAACGTVQVMLNGSIETGAFRNDSFFGGIEVPNLNPDKVSTMHIWLMHDIDGPQSESCTGRSITTLKYILTSRKISVFCEENYSKTIDVLGVLNLHSFSYPQMSPERKPSVPVQSYTSKTSICDVCFQQKFSSNT